MNDALCVDVREGTEQVLQVGNGVLCIEAMKVVLEGVRVGKGVGRKRWWSQRGEWRTCREPLRRVACEP